MGEKPSRPIKVMHIIARMNVGGPAVEITELMRGLDPNVISQRLVTGYCNDDEADFLDTQAPDISATRIDGLGRSIRPTDDAKALATLVRIIRASRPDIIHTHTAKAGVLGRIAAKASGTDPKIIHTYHGHLLHGYFGEAKTRSITRLERGLARYSSTLVTVGNRVRDDLLHAGIGTLSQYAVIRSAVRLKPLPDKAKARRQLGLSQGTPVVALIGRLTHIKRPDRFLDMVRIMKQKGVTAEFLVVGGGDQELSLRRRIDKELLPVRLLGWRSDLETILAATDVLTLTSDNEGLPLVILQAQLAGVPAVACDVGSVREVVADGVNGYIAACTPDSLAERVCELLTRPDMLSEMSIAARFSSAQESAHALFLEGHTRVYVESQK